MQLGQLPRAVLVGHCFFVGTRLKACGRCEDGYAREASVLFVCRIWLLGPSQAQRPTSCGLSLNRLNSKSGCVATQACIWLTLLLALRCISGGHAFSNQSCLADTKVTGHCSQTGVSLATY